LSLDGESNPLHEVEVLALARILVAQRERGDAIRLLARLRQAAQARGLAGRLIEVLALQAVAFHEQGDVAQATATLEHALSLAAPEGYVRTFVDEGEPMAALLRAVAARGGALDTVSKLLAAFEDRVAGDRRGEWIPPWSSH
jgi:LuxR family maltose regulon positive regulatory protein